MKNTKLTRTQSLILALILAVQAVCLCFVCSACTSAGAETNTDFSAGKSGSDEWERLSLTEDTVLNYSEWLSRNYSSGVLTRALWLRDLMAALDIADFDLSTGDYAALFQAAFDSGISGSAEPSAFTALTREYAADTLVNALGYKDRVISPVSDAVKGDGIMTLAYYGYFLPDEEDRLNPQALVTGDEYSMLLEQLSIYKALRGKRLLSFGDSIMYGAATRGRGLSDMIGEKYGMTVTDYAVSGAVFGRYSDRSVIPGQIEQSIKNGDKADLILIDGATNDMLHVPLGKMTDGYKSKKYDRDTFAGGMEYSFSLLNKHFKDVPVLYVRAHDMDLCGDATEKQFGEYGVKVAEKWKAATADIYEDTDFDTEDFETSEKYTYYRSHLLRTDSVHPTALGYAKFYLPLVCARIARITQGES